MPHVLQLRVADVSLPFGGVPVGVKELTPVEGWPDTEASVPLRDGIASHTATMVHRLVERGGAVLAGQTTASEFGGVNLTRTKLHGATHNPWQHGTDTGRVVGWLGGGGRRGHLPDRHRRRRRRLDPDPCRLHGPRRVEGDVRAHSAGPARRVRQPHRVDRLHGALGT